MFLIIKLNHTKALRVFHLITKHRCATGLGRRFTQHEKAAIEFAALDNPAAPIEERQQAALLRASLADQAAAQFIDLADPSTIAGVQLLVQAGLLSEERGQQVLLASAAP